MHNHLTTGTQGGKWRGVDRDFLAFLAGPVQALLLWGGGGGLVSLASPFPRGGGGVSKSLPPRFLAPKGRQAHGLHPRFVGA